MYNAFYRHLQGQAGIRDADGRQLYMPRSTGDLQNIQYTSVLDNLPGLESSPLIAVTVLQECYDGRNRKAASLPL